MPKRTLFAAFITSAMLSSAAASEDLKGQIDTIAPLIAANQLQDLGGPANAAGLLEAIDGRWFTLDATVRNWDRTDDQAATLARSLERLCAKDWENIVTITRTGPDRFLVDQRSPDGVDNGSMELVSSDPNGRHFTTGMTDEDIIAAYGLENADAMRQQKAIEDFKDSISEGAKIWMPTPDLMVMESAVETEVSGRCPL